MVRKGKERFTNPSFRSKMYLTAQASHLRYQISEAYFNIDTTFEEFMREGSGWNLDKIIKLEATIAEYLPISGNSYIPLPRKPQLQKAILNIQNMTNVASSGLCWRVSTQCILIRAEYLIMIYKYGFPGTQECGDVTFP